MSEGVCPAPERLIMFEVAHGFEQITWLLHRFALQIDPLPKLFDPLSSKLGHTRSRDFGRKRMEGV